VASQFRPTRYDLNERIPGGRQLGEIGVP